MSVAGLRPGKVDSECGDWRGRIFQGSVGHRRLVVQCNMHTMDVPLRRVVAGLAHMGGV